MNALGLEVHEALMMAAPSPSDGRELNSVTVSPGLPGFFAMFVLAVAIVLLLVDMARRVRRVQAKGRVEERMAARSAEQREHSGVETDADATDDARHGTGSAEERPPGARGDDEGPTGPPASR